MVSKTLLLSIFTFGILFLFPQFSYALTVSPPSLELGGFPGDNIRTNFRIFNETNKTKTFYISTANFKAKEGREGEPSFEGEATEDTLAGWIEYPKAPIILTPGETRQIEFKINIPSWAPAGGHFGAIFLGDQPSDIETTGIGVASKVGVLLLLRVEGKIIEEGKLLEFKLKDGKNFYNSLPIDFIYRFENSGNVHLKPTGFIEIRNIFKGLAASLVVNANELKVLPSSARTFENQWLKKLYNEAPKSFWEKIRYQQENFALGRYVAKLNLQFGQNGKVALGEVSFWVLPWQLILFYFVIVIVIVMVLFLLIRQYNKFIIEKAMGKKK